jgi:ATP/maltotriose-dependent transcriptional regulator MalT
VQDLYVFAMSGVAYMHARNRDGELALSVLHQLDALPLSLAAQGYVAVYTAHAHASAARQGPALRAMDRADGLLSNAADEAPSRWLGITGRAFVERQRAMILAGFGSPEARSILGGLDDQTPAVFQRYRVTMLADQAMAHAWLGHVEQSARLLGDALRRNRQVRSVEKATLIGEVRAVLSPYADSRAVRAVDEALRAARVATLTPGGKPAGR